jgi:outer membrane protein assembly factor BamE (lipoprotein component of BamABCDE complex)
VDRRIEPGMTSDMVVAALGKPDAITHQGDMEKWGYRDTTRVMMGEMRFEDVYVVYLRNGFVVRTVGNPNALSSQPWYR